MYRKEGAKLLKPSDFFPSLADAEGASKEMTGAESLAYMKLVSAAFGGDKGKRHGKRR